MAIGGLLGGSSKSKQDSKSKSKSLSGQTKTGVSGGVSTGAILDKDTINLLKGGAGQSAGLFGAGVSAGGADLGFAESIRNRASGLEDELQGENAAIIAAAQARGEERLGTQQNQLATQAGSTLNSLVQANLEKGNIQLETELAGLEGRLNLDASNQATQALAGAQAGSLGATAGAQSPFVNIANILKGSTQTQKSTQFSLEDILRAGTGKQENEGDGSTSKTPGVIDFI